MARLFITAFCVLIASILLAFLSVDKIEKQLYRGINVDFFEYIDQGTFALLEDAIAGRSGEDLRDVVALITSRFKYPVSLEQKQDLDLPAQALAKLESGGVYLHSSEGSSSILRASVHTDGIWSLPARTGLRKEREMASYGVLSLVKDKLVGKSPEVQSLLMEQMQRLTDIPIKLQTQSELDLSEKDIARLRNQKIVVNNPGDNGEQFWIEIEPGGLIFNAGPISYPTSNNHVRTILNISFYAILLTGCLFWLWPLCSDLQRLRRAVPAMGRGKLDTRVRTRKTSLIRSVLEGFNHMANRTETMVANKLIAHKIVAAISTALS